MRPKLDREQINVRLVAGHRQAEREGGVLGFAEAAHPQASGGVRKLAKNLGVPWRVSRDARRSGFLLATASRGRVRLLPLEFPGVLLAAVYPLQLSNTYCTSQLYYVI